AVDTPLPMVHVPTIFQRQRLTAHPTQPLLLQPKVTHRPTTRQRFLHLVTETLLEVRLPRRIVGVRVTPNLYASPYTDRAGREQVNDRAFPVSADDYPCKHSLPATHPFEILRLHPGSTFLVVSPTRPPP